MVFRKEHRSNVLVLRGPIYKATPKELKQYFTCYRKVGQEWRFLLLLNSDVSSSKTKAILQSHLLAVNFNNVP